MTHTLLDIIHSSIRFQFFDTPSSIHLNPTSDDLGFVAACKKTIQFPWWTAQFFIGQIAQIHIEILRDKDAGLSRFALTKAKPRQHMASSQ